MRDEAPLSITICPQCRTRTPSPRRLPPAAWPLHCSCGAVYQQARELPTRWLLGNIVAWLLRKVGITKRLVRRITRRPCGCDSRQAALNELSCPTAPPPKTPAGSAAAE